MDIVAAVDHAIRRGDADSLRPFVDEAEASGLTLDRATGACSA